MQHMNNSVLQIYGNVWLDKEICVVTQIKLF